MASAGDGYEGAGAGGKFRKKPFRRSQATPYDRPPIALRNPSIGGTSSLLSKIVDPASKLIYAGAHRLFGAFRNRLTLPSPERPPEANQEPNDRRLGEVVINLGDCTRTPEQRNNQNGNSSNPSGATEISELEKMLKQRSFTRSEMERLTELLRSRTSDLPFEEDEGEREEPKVQSSLLNQNRNGADVFRASVSTPIDRSEVLKKDTASPAELAKAYMGSRPSKVSPSMLGLRNQAPREDSPLLSNGSVFPKSPISLQLSLASKATKGVGIPENGFTTPRSRGRSAIYSMARSPYLRMTDGHKGIVPYDRPSSSLTPYLSAREQEGPVGSKQMALKRGSSVLEDEIGSVGPIRRTRQKHNLLSQGGFLSARGKEHGSGAVQYLPSSSEKLLLTNEPGHELQKPVERNGGTAKPFSRYASVPTESSEMATRILQHLEKMSPKEKPSQYKDDPSGKKSPTKLTPTMLHGQALRSMDTLDSSKFLNNVPGHKSDDLHGAYLPIDRDSTLQKGKVEENSSKMFAVPRNLLTPVSSDVAVSDRDTGGSVKIAKSFLKTATEPPQKKRAFQMSAHEDFFDMDDEIHSNGVASTLVVEKDEKLKTSVFATKDFSPEAVLPSKSLALPESNTSAPSVSIQRAEFGTSNGSTAVGEKTGLTFSSSPAISTTYQPSVLTESTLVVDKFTPPKETNASPSSTISTKTVDKVQPFAVTSSVFGSESSGTEISSWSDAKPESSSSLVNVVSVSTNGQVKVPVSNKGDNNSSQNTVDGIRKPDTLPSAESDATKSSTFSFGISAKNTDLNNNEKATNAIGNTNSLPSSDSAAPVKSGIYSFGSPAQQSDPNGTLASSPFSSLSTSPDLASSNISNQSLNGSSSHVDSSTMSSLPSSGIIASTTTTSGPSTTAASPIFSFGSSMPLATPVSASTPPATSGTETTDSKIKDDPKSPFGNSTTPPFGGSSFSTTGSLFGFSSSTASSTTANSQSQPSLFSTGSESLANASTVSTQSAPFQFGSTAAPSVFGTSGSAPLSPAISPFSSSAPTSANPFSSTTASFGQSSAAPSSDANANSAASTPSTFGSGWQPAKSSVFGSTFSSPSQSTGFSFGASSSTSTASTGSAPSMVFGSATTGSSLFSFGSGASTTPPFPSFSQTQPVFGNTTPAFSAPSGNGNDQMGMEDSMAEDPMHSPSPSPAPSATPAFGQPQPQPAFGHPPSPGFMFGNTAPAPSPAFQGVPFQFGGQQNPAAAPGNPFQASSSVEFNAGGSFSLGSGGGGGDKSGRRMVRISKNKNRKK